MYQYTSKDPTSGQYSIHQALISAQMSIRVADTLRQDGYLDAQEISKGYGGNQQMTAGLMTSFDLNQDQKIDAAEMATLFMVQDSSGQMDGDISIEEMDTLNRLIFTQPNVVREYALQLHQGHQLQSRLQQLNVTG